MNGPKAYIITIMDHEPSVAQAKVCQSTYPGELFPASTPATQAAEYEARGLKYGGEVNTPPKAACTMSHIRLWEKALEETILVLEHDAIVYPFDYQAVLDSGYDIVSLKAHKQGHCGIGPKVNGFQKQNQFESTAYIMTPAGAEKALAAAYPVITQHDRAAFSRKLDCLGAFVEPHCREQENLRTSHGY